MFRVEPASFLGVMTGLMVLVFLATGCGPTSVSTPESVISTETAPPTSPITPTASDIRTAPASPLPDKETRAAGPTPGAGTGDATKSIDSTLTSTSGPTESQTDLIREHRSGYSFSLPEGWEISDVALISTSFSADAECSGANIIDREPPSGSGQAPFLFQSVFQVCARDTQGQSLDEFMESVYGQLEIEFVPVEVGGLSGYRFDQESSALIFAQTESHRFQLVTSVVAEPDLEALREDQVRRLIGSVDFQ